MQLDGLVQTHERAREWMLEESKKIPIVRLIETAPGIGEIRAPLIVAIVISPQRFALGASFGATAAWLLSRALRRTGRRIATASGSQRCPPDLGTQSQPTSAAQECFQGRCRGCRQSHAATSAKACLRARDRFGNQTQPRTAHAGASHCWCGAGNVEEQGEVRPDQEARNNTHAWLLARWLLPTGDFAQQNRFREAASLGPLVTAAASRPLFEVMPSRSYQLKQ